MKIKKETVNFIRWVVIGLIIFGLTNFTLAQGLGPKESQESAPANHKIQSVTVEGVTIQIPMSWVRSSKHRWDGKDGLILHFLVTTSNTKEIGGLYLSSQIEQETQDYYEDKKGGWLDVRYLEIDSIKGVHYRDVDDFEQRATIFWSALREYKGQPQLVSIGLSSLEKTFSRDKTLLYQILNSVKFTIDEYDQRNSLAKKYLESGSIHHQNGNYQQAFADFTEGIKIAPNDYILHKLLTGRSATLFSSERYDEEITDRTKVIKLGLKIYRDPDDVLMIVGDDYQKRAITYSIKGDYQNALADYTKIFELTDSAPDGYFKNSTLFLAYYTRAGIYQELKQYDKAISDFTKILEMKNLTKLRLSYMYFFRGIAYSKNGQFENAVADLTKSIDLDSKATEPYKERAKAYRKVGKLAEAEADEATAKRLENQ